MSTDGPRANTSTRVTVERYVSGGVLIFGAIGATVGLVIGLVANPATAWFAAFELGFPAAVLGTIVSAAAGVVVAAVHRTRA